jgi:hypothetical protein
MTSVSVTPLLDRETAAVDVERSRDILLACTSGLRLGLLGEGDVVAASFASAERLRGQIEQLSVPVLLRCADSLTRWLDSPGGLPSRGCAWFADVAGDVVGLVEQCVDAALVEAPPIQMEALLVQIEACCAPAGEAVDPVPADDTAVDAFVDDALDELDRCEDLLLRAELEGATREGLEALMVELAALVDGGEKLGIAGLDAAHFGTRLEQFGSEPALGGMIERMLRCVDDVRLAVEICHEERGGAAATSSIPLSEFLKRLRRGCRDRAREAGRRIQVEVEFDGMARVSLAAAQNFYELLLAFAGEAVAATLEHCADDVPQLRMRAGIENDRVQLEIEDDAVDQAVAGETVQSLDARTAAAARLPLHPYRRGYVNVVQVLVR